MVGTNGNRPEVVDFLNQFIDQEVQCAMGGVQASSRISPNVNVGSDCYVNDLLADASAILTEALASGTGGFDASDLMPAEVGQGSFWTGMVDYMKEGPDSVKASWTRSRRAGPRRASRKARDAAGVVAPAATPPRAVRGTAAA